MASSYTDMNRQSTRVVKRDEDEGVPRPEEESIGHTQLMQVKKPGLFEGISLAQVIAGAAAAATSMVLSSYIGIGGSVIGAAVSSVVTVVSSQLYRRFLDASAEKIRRGGAAVREAASVAGAPAHSARAATADATTVIGTDRGTAATRVMDPAGRPVRGARVAPPKLQARAAAERSATQRKVVAFSVAIAVVAVAACALAILLGTGGAGIGVKTEPLFASPSIEETDDGGAGTNRGAAAPDSSTSSSDDAANGNATASDGTSGTGATGATGGSSQTSTDANGGTTSSGTSGDAGTGAGSTGSGTDGGGTSADGSDGTAAGGSTGTGAQDGSTGTGTGTSASNGTTKSQG